MDQEKKLRISLAKLLDRKRFEHCLRVQKVAQNLAKHYGANIHQAATAGLLHDCARFWSPGQLLDQARKRGIPISAIEEFEPKILHAGLSAQLAAQKFGVKNKAVLKAIAYHTFGKPKISKLEKIIYIADHIENKRRFKGVGKIRRLAFRDLDQSVLEIANSMLKFLVKNKLPILLKSVLTRNYYLLKTNGN